MYKIGDIILVEGSGLGGLLIKVGNIWASLFKLNKSVNFTHSIIDPVQEFKDSL